MRFLRRLLPLVLLAALPALASDPAPDPAATACAFDGLAEPALRDAYYRLSPDFWDWLRAAGSPTLPKPKG